MADYEVIFSEPVGPIRLLRVYQYPKVLLECNSILHNQSLYLRIQFHLVEGMSKEGFVAVLEHAEEVLQCQRVVLYFPNGKSDPNGKWIQTFMYMGFEMLPPGHPLNIFAGTGDVYMVYNVNA